ncbi:MAG TPA: citryl-CoA lyase [Candidatus Acidoferrales bacterium]|nr:citryl-CoA lyase [Candidatus Acidoferrales bacterium]
MADKNKIVTGLGKAEERRILVRGRDLIEELLGKISFTEMTWLMLAGRMPTPAEARMIDALLVVLVEHGMVSSVVAARLTYETAPESLQGAVAASLLGAGSVHLGSSEYAAKWMVDALPPQAGDADLDQLARKIVDEHAQQKKRIAGIGHRTHPHGDPRAVKLFEIARETGVYGRYSELIQRVSAAAKERHGRAFPPNVTGAIAAIALDMGVPWQLTKGFALIGRTLGTIAHIGEEIKNPTWQALNSAIKAQLVYEP